MEQNKIGMYKHESFSKKEIDFFNKLAKDNSHLHYTFEIDDYFLSIVNDLIQKVNIYKLEDEWYLIYRLKFGEDNQYYICDEWEEVIGYLSNNGFIK
jgi:hypothetical protein